MVILLWNNNFMYLMGMKNMAVADVVICFTTLYHFLVIVKRFSSSDPCLEAGSQNC